VAKALPGQAGAGLLRAAVLWDAAFEEVQLGIVTRACSGKLGVFAVLNPSGREGIMGARSDALSIGL
jgi:hypothetical protein